MRHKILWDFESQTDHLISARRPDIVSKVSKVGDHSRGWPEGSLFDSYYT